MKCILSGQSKVSKPHNPGRDKRESGVKAGEEHIPWSYKMEELIRYFIGLLCIFNIFKVLKSTCCIVRAPR